MHPTKQTPYQIPLCSTKKPYDIISDSEFGGGGVYCASLLLAGCRLVPKTTSTSGMQPYCFSHRDFMAQTFYL